MVLPLRLGYYHPPIFILQGAARSVHASPPLWRTFAFFCIVFVFGFCDKKYD